MGGKRPKRARPTRLTGRWFIEEIGECRLSIPSTRDIENVDATWTANRPEGAPNRHWNWAGILRACPERFALYGPGDKVLALWGSTKSLCKLEGKSWYRLDYLEVAPTTRRAFVGALAMALIGNRAIELGAHGIVLAAFEDAAYFYGRLEGTRRLVQGWQHEKGLIPFAFEGEGFRKLVERLDEFAEETEEDSIL